MLIYEDECVCCPPEMGCRGQGCPNLEVPHYYCDGCGEEFEDYYEYEGEYFCESCYIEIVLENAEKISGEKLITGVG